MKARGSTAPSGRESNWSVGVVRPMMPWRKRARHSMMTSAYLESVRKLLHVSAVMIYSQYHARSPAGFAYHSRPPLSSWIIWTTYPFRDKMSVRPLLYLFLAHQA